MDSDNVWRNLRAEVPQTLNGDQDISNTMSKLPKAFRIYHSLQKYLTVHMKILHYFNVLYYSMEAETGYFALRYKNK